MNAVTITRDLLRTLPLSPPEGADKRARGVVLVIGGCVEAPGGAMLAAQAALRAGAGKARIATCRSIAPLIATAIPETRVYGLPENNQGSIDIAAVDALERPIAEADTILIGPGMVDAESAAELAAAIVRRIDTQTVIVDAAALALLSHDRTALHHLRGRCAITPHRREMSLIVGVSEESISTQPAETAHRYADEFGAVTVLKGDETFIAGPEPSEAVGSVFPPLHSADEPDDGRQRLYRNTAGNAGLATSGSGDVLSGILAALTARGIDPLPAAVWAVYAHAVAGDRLQQKIGIGFLARELMEEIPCTFAALMDGKGHA
jgi:hydroxyethylthiazole kinase-like uncharacterized protein yjeF